jgi:hypothetical protein
MYVIATDPGTITRVPGVGFLSPKTRVVTSPYGHTRTPRHRNTPRAEAVHCGHCVPKVGATRLPHKRRHPNARPAIGLGPPHVTNCPAAHAKTPMAIGGRRTALPRVSVPIKPPFFLAHASNSPSHTVVAITTTAANLPLCFLSESSKHLSSTPRHHSYPHAHAWVSSTPHCAGTRAAAAASPLSRRRPSPGTSTAPTPPQSRLR